MGMGAAVVKYLKWLVSVGFLILGLAFLQIFADTGNIRPIGIVILSFGIVFWMSKSTYEAPKKVFITSLVVLVVAGLLSKMFFADFVGAMLGSESSYYFGWFLCAAAIGLPVMIHNFMKNE